MAKFCVNCGSSLIDTANFCGGCGKKVPTSVPPPAAFTPVPLVAADTALSAVPATFAPAPVAPVDPAGFAPVPAAYTPMPQAPAPSTIPAGGSSVGQNASYAPVNGLPAASPALYTPVAAGYAPAAGQPGMVYPAAKKSNTLLKVVLAIVILIFVGGALAIAGLWYAAVKIKAKVHAVASQVLDEGSPSSSTGLAGLLATPAAGDNGKGGITGDPCRFLTKAEVSQAVGLPILRAEAQDSSCSYIAKGDPAEVTAKHLSSMLSGMGADAQAQAMAQKFAKGLFAQQETSDKDLSAEAAKGEITVLSLVFTAGRASEEMKLNRRAFAHIGATEPSAGSRSTASGDLEGIGDEAYSAAGSMILLRKGNVMARMLYVSCPCNTDNIKPLARTLASRL